MKRRNFLMSLAALALAPREAAAQADILRITKTPSCGCCGAWADRMSAAGFEIELQEAPLDELYDLKARLGIAPEHSACHTAEIAGYFVEGHVPAADIRRLLAERPDALGIAVPGMPIGSPGMEQGDVREPYATLLIRDGGRADVFESHN